MNQIFSLLSQGLLFLLCAVLALALLGWLLRSPRVKGWWGEQKVRRLIRQRLNPLVYVDVHHVTLPTAEGGSTQIDHLIFSPYGLFVLETKNFQGWIFGSEKQRDWTQQIFKKRSRFQNPLRQNYKHLKTLQDLLGVQAEHLHSVIAFVGDCEFKTEMPPQVTRGDGFVSYIQSFDQTVWSPEQMQALLDKLEEVRLQPGRATDRQHVAHVKELHAGERPAGERLTATRQTASVPMAEAADVTGVEAVVEAPPASVDILLEPEADMGLDIDLSHDPEVAPDVPLDAAPDVPPDADPHKGQHVESHASPAADVPSPGSSPQPSATLAPPAAAHRLIDGVPVCPQCEWPLRRLLMQRGPLAGQGVWRCTNVAACHFVHVDA